MRRFRAIEIFILKADSLPATTFSSGSDLFVEVALGYNMNMRTRVHHGAGQARVVRVRRIRGWQRDGEDLSRGTNEFDTRRGIGCASTLCITRILALRVSLRCSAPMCTYIVVVSCLCLHILRGQSLRPHRGSNGASASRSGVQGICLSTSPDNNHVCHVRFRACLV